MEKTQVRNQYLLQVRWRSWMTRDYLDRWLSRHAFYKMELARFSTLPAGAAAHHTPDNPDQRIQEDLYLFTTHTVALTMGLLNAVVMLGSFVGLLWVVSGPLDFTFGGTTYTVQGYMVWVAVLYCLVGSVITHYIGRPQIRLNFFQKKYEADFRHHMVRVREYSESIALDKGETVERTQLDMRFSSVLSNYMMLIRKQKALTWFTGFFSQSATIFPIIVAAPRFFSGAIQLGGLMQIATAFEKVLASMSWFVNNYSSIAAWRATTDRLTSFDDSIRAIAHQGRAQEGVTSIADEQISIPVDGVGAANLALSLPAGTKLLSGASLQAGSGETVLVRGPSGSGKSTLFRALAGIWPFSSGQTQLPSDAMFIPQRPYFPDGRLRDALAYPQPASRYTDEALKQALQDALLPRLVSRLDSEDAWSHKLSGGEQQRLAIARVLLKKPTWIFADEATSALDDEAEQTLYERLLAHVGAVRGGLVSISHRTSVGRFHRRAWTFEHAPDGSSAQFSLTDTTLPKNSEAGRATSKNA